MSSHGPWRTDDFDALSWHDAHVHGLNLNAFNSDLGTADLSLDIDFILRWKSLDSGFEFTVSQATLCFHEVSDLRVALDYKSPTAGMCPFAIDHIEREQLEWRHDGETYRWVIVINWPPGSIEFASPGFTQTLIGVPHVQTEQWLQEQDRRSASAA